MRRLAKEREIGWMGCPKRDRTDGVPGEREIGWMGCQKREIVWTVCQERER